MEALLTHTVHASVPSNTFAIYGNGEDKELTELVPGILNQLGPDSLASLRRLAESYQNMQKKEGGDKKDDDDDEEEGKGGKGAAGGGCVSFFSTSTSTLVLRSCLGQKG